MVTSLFTKPISFVAYDYECSHFSRYTICRQSHRAFFGKSDIFFVCMLRPTTYDIQVQETEIEAAQVILSYSCCIPSNTLSFKLLYTTNEQVLVHLIAVDAI